VAVTSTMGHATAGGRRMVEGRIATEDGHLVTQSDDLKKHVPPSRQSRSESREYPNREGRISHP
jgi:hypothetical protein